MRTNWWKEAVVYQIYPRSFNDSNGDGIGDLLGIIAKLDYIQSLGVDIIWLSPIYASPNDDNGYDISDYYSIMEEFGTMSDFNRLLQEIHNRGMKLIMDLVVNHTSDEHSWFVESKSSPTSPYRDYYIWRDGKNGREPNNWKSMFSFSAWEKDPASDQYYLHLFSKKQPDLNWENEQVRHEIYKMMRWWLDKGVDGFRMDVINLIAKADGLPDAVPEDTDESDQYYVFGGELYADQPGMHEYLQEMNQEVLSRYDIATVGECAFVNSKKAHQFTHPERSELDMVFALEFLWDCPALPDMKKRLQGWIDLTQQGGWFALPFGAHDYPRLVSYFGNDAEFREESSKLFATLLLSLPGTPFLYQGDEIGMTNVAFDSIEEYRDIQSLNEYKERLEQGESGEEVLKSIQKSSRDNSRTPIQWDASTNAGFTSGTPWIGTNPNFQSINIAESEKNPDSILNYYRALIRFRKEHPIFVYGTYEDLCPDDQNLFAIKRTWEQQTCVVLLNFSSVSISVPDSILPTQPASVLSQTNYPEASEDASTMRPWETRIYSDFTSS